MAYKMVYNPLTGKWDKVWVDEGSSSGSGSGSSGSGSGDAYGGSTNPKPNPETSITAYTFFHIHTDRITDLHIRNQP